MTGRYRILIQEPGKPYNKRLAPPKLSGWSLFVSICRSLHRDGLKYKVELCLDAPQPHVIVRASGQMKHSKAKRPAKVHVCQPKPLDNARCAKELTVAEKTLAYMRGRMHGRVEHMYEGYPGRLWRYGGMARAARDWQPADITGEDALDALRNRKPQDWREYAAQRKLLSRWLARRLAGDVVVRGVTPADYKALDAICGRRVKRVTEIGANYRPDGIKEYVVRELCGVYRYNAGAKKNEWNERDEIGPFPFAEFQAALLDVEYWREMENLSGLRDRAKPGLTSDSWREDNEVQMVA